MNRKKLVDELWDAKRFSRKNYQVVMRYLHTMLTRIFEPTTLPIEHIHRQVVTKRS